MKILCVNMVLMLLVTAALSYARQTVGGIIDRDTRWNVDEGPYVVEKDILVTRRARLIITPGTHVIINRDHKPEPAIAQFDRLDSSMVSIRIEGALICSGRKDKRISFAVAGQREHSSGWYGIIFDGAADQFSEMSFADISGAHSALTFKKCAPLIRSSIFEFNHIGITCMTGGSARVLNCVIARNFAAGIRIQDANPEFRNNIIAFNRNNGLWCDGVSKVHFFYNCVYGNSDGNFLECDPELGIITKGRKKGDLTDVNHNICRNPVFAGSAADSAAVEHDIALQTDRAKIRDTLIARVLYDSLPDSTALQRRDFAPQRYQLSRYSPCIDAGDPAARYHDSDGSRNDMGAFGGPEFTSGKK